MDRHIQIDNKIICPNCKSENICPILYGLPINIMLMDEKASEGKIYLAGCKMPRDASLLYCNSCEHRFGKVKDPFPLEWENHLEILWKKVRE